MRCRLLLLIASLCMLASAGCRTTTDGNGVTDVPARVTPDVRQPTPDVPAAAVDVAGQQRPFTYPTGCRLPADSAADAGGWRLADAFPDLPAFAQPLALKSPLDGSGQLYVAERAGRIRAFDNRSDASQSRLVLDFSAKVYTGSECGFLGLAFDPAFAQNRHLYTSYCTRNLRSGDVTSIISRWTMAAGAGAVVDPSSELEILRQHQPWDNHDGGDIAFGPDGLLYIGFGDGGSGNDPLNSGQDLGTWLGAMLRVDVRGLSATQGYTIPADNPFADGAGGRPEIYAWGLRNPWRFSFDRLTGALWAGDVGQNALEEIDIIERGGNYGWKIMEASACRPGGGACDPTGLVLPVAEYPRNLGRSVTGGFVYRGTRLPALYGAYLYADFTGNIVFAYRHGEEPPPTAPFTTTPTGIAAFGEDAAGELYLLGLATGRLYQLQRIAPRAPNAPGFPTTLSATGCFSDLMTLTPATGVLPYALNVPFWSDGADKRRFISLPADETITPSAAGPWDFPVGTVFIKHFEMSPGDGLPAQRLETRLLVKDADRVRGYSYRWDADGRDAQLLPGADTRPVTFPDGSAGTWRFPSRGQCNTCHTAASGGVLGPRTAQLNREGRFPGVADGAPVQQLDALNALGLLQPAVAVASAARYPRLDDAAAPVADRARAWLASNCANCHLPAGPSGVDLDLRFGTALADTQACDVVPVRHDLGLADARIIAPGDPARSVLAARLDAPEPHRMPPISSTRVDPVGRSLVRDWITATTACP